MATPRPKRQITGNAGLNCAAWQLFRRGWYVGPTIRNAKGSDLFIANTERVLFFGMPFKASSKRDVASLIANLAELRSDWRSITTFAHSDARVCHILRLEAVRALAAQGRNGGM